MIEPQARPDDRIALYHLYGARNRLLYIGITNDPRRRFAEHASTQDWWPQVICRDVEWFPDRVSALKAEADAIYREKPRHNAPSLTWEPDSPRPVRTEAGVFSLPDEVADEFGVEHGSYSIRDRVIRCDARGMIVAVTDTWYRPDCRVTRTSHGAPPSRALLIAADHFLGPGHPVTRIT